MINASNLDEMIPISCNTEDRVLFSNVRAAVGLDLPWLGLSEPHEKVAVIVGGGPSMKGLLPMIAGHQKAGHDVFALNGVVPTLKGADVTPDYFVMLDARPENIGFVQPDPATKYLIASQCDPGVFEKLEGFDVTLWHPRYEGIAECIDRPQFALMGGGCTVGLMAMCVAYAMGYRSLHLYGFDSSYSSGGDGHAYAQPANDEDGRETVYVAGQSFVAAPWMVRQAVEFQEIAHKLAEDDVIIQVHGSGLLPAVAKAMAANYAPEKPYEGRVAFVCVNVGTKYPMVYVEVLRDMIARHADGMEYDIYCITDRVGSLPEGVVGIEADPELPGWWQKVNLFSPDMPWERGRRVAYMDLDVAITGPLSRLVSRPGIISDWNWPTYNSSVMVWDHGEHAEVWEQFTAEVMTSPGSIVQPDWLPGSVNGGDQEWITEAAQQAGKLWPVFSPDMCVSYREHAIDYIPPGAVVVVFHGEPKPHEAEGWVPEHWRKNTDYVLRGQWWWPANDCHASHVVLQDCIPDIEALLPHVDGRSCIVQAGGNVGVYPKALAKVFDKVVTAEPDPANYECLKRNINGHATIQYLNCAFGPEAGACEPVHLDETNCGAHYVDFGTGDVPVKRIDDLGLSACDAIWLDIEGAELLALKGAEATINRFSPTISVEDKGLNETFGIPNGAVQAWLAERGYQQVGAHGRDVIFKRKA